jgi:hypothetical protein
VKKRQRIHAAKQIAATYAMVIDLRLERDFVVSFRLKRHVIRAMKPQIATRAVKLRKQIAIHAIKDV